MSSSKEKLTTFCWTFDNKLQQKHFFGICFRQKETYPIIAEPLLKIYFSSFLSRKNIEFWEQPIIEFQAFWGKAVPYNADSAIQISAATFVASCYLVNEASFHEASFVSGTTHLPSYFVYFDSLHTYQELLFSLNR